MQGLYAIRVRDWLGIGLRLGLMGQIYIVYIYIAYMQLGLGIGSCKARVYIYLDTVAIISQPGTAYVIRMRDERASE